MSWVPAWEPWPVRLCAYRGCRNPRFVETRQNPRGQITEHPRRWCRNHCSVRAVGTVLHPADILRFP